MDKREEIRAKALADLQHSGVLMLNGHFDYGNGYHGKAYLNPHQLFRQPSTIWRFAQDLLDIVPSEICCSASSWWPVRRPAARCSPTRIAGLLDSRRSLTYPPCLFAPFHHNSTGGFTLRDFYRSEIKGKRVLLADDVRNTGETFERCATLVQGRGRRAAGDDGNLRSHGIGEPARRAELRARRIPRAGKLPGARVSALCKSGSRSRGSRSRAQGQAGPLGRPCSSPSPERSAYFGGVSRSVPIAPAVDLGARHPHLPVTHGLPVAEEVVVVRRQKVSRLRRRRRGSGCRWPARDPRSAGSRGLKSDRRAMSPRPVRRSRCSSRRRSEPID